MPRGAFAPRFFEAVGRGKRPADHYDKQQKEIEGGIPEADGRGERDCFGAAKSKVGKAQKPSVEGLAV